MSQNADVSNRPRRPASAPGLDAPSFVHHWPVTPPATSGRAQGSGRPEIDFLRFSDASLGVISPATS